MKSLARLFTTITFVFVTQMAQAGVLKRICETLLLGPPRQSALINDVKKSASSDVGTPAPVSRAEANAHVEAHREYLKTQTPDVLLQKAIEGVRSLKTSNTLPQDIVTALKNPDVMALDSRFISYLAHNGFLEEIIENDGLRYARHDQGLFEYIASDLVSKQVPSALSTQYLLYLFTTRFGQTQAMSNAQSIFEFAQKANIDSSYVTQALLAWYKTAHENANAAEMKRAVTMMKRILNTLLPDRQEQIQYELSVNPNHNLSGRGAETSAPALNHLNKVYDLLKSDERALYYSLVESTLKKQWLYFFNGLHANDYRANHDLNTQRSPYRQISFTLAINHYSSPLFDILETLTDRLGEKVILDTSDSANLRLALSYFRIVERFYNKSLYTYLESQMRPDLATKYRRLVQNRLDELHQYYLQMLASSKFSQISKRFQNTVLLNPSMSLNPRIQNILKTCQSTAHAQCLFTHFMEMPDDEFENFFKSTNRQSTLSSSPTGLNHSGTESIEDLRHRLQ